MTAAGALAPSALPSRYPQEIHTVNKSANGRAFPKACSMAGNSSPVHLPLSVMHTVDNFSNSRG
ncbi:hypothetical protein QFZ40_003964 [Arthrobacter pascens]|nr:hypothetical protein [Arthrobacter pascens]